MKLNSSQNIGLNVTKYKNLKKVDKNLSFLANYNTPENTEIPSVENLVANFMPYAKKDIDLSNAKNRSLTPEAQRVIFEAAATTLLEFFAKNKNNCPEDSPAYTDSIQEFCSAIAPKFKDEPELSAIVHQLSVYFEPFGMTQMKELMSFSANVYGHDSSKVCFDGKITEACSIFNQLNNKNYIHDYPFLLSYIYTDEKDKKSPDYSKLNTYPRFLEENKIYALNTAQDDIKLKNRFFMLYSRFNEFETLEDINDMIGYCLSVKDKKIDLIKGLLAKHPDLYKKSAEQFYSDFAQIVDFYFEESDGKSLDELDKYFDYFIQANKINATVKTKLAGNFPFLRTKKDETTSADFFKKTEFFEFLSKYNISIKELNALYATSIVKDETDPKDIILLKDRIVNALTERNSKSLKDNEKLYATFAPVFVEIVKAKQDNDLLKTTLDVFEFYQIKSQKDIIDLYNKVYPKQKVTELTSNTLVDFIDLLSYADDSSKVLIKHKDFNTLRTQLETKQKTYLKTIAEIQKYIKNNPDSFSGLSAYDLYDKYVSKFLPNTDINSKLIEISQNVNQDTQTKAKIRPFFIKLSDFNDFVNLNKIDFDLSVDGSYRSACLEILNSIASLSNGNIKTQKNMIKTLNESGFLINSKDDLAEFVKKTKTVGNLDKLVNIIINQKVESLSELKEFIDTYSNDEKDDESVIEFLASVKDYSLSDTAILLEKLQNALDKLDLRVRLNAKNLKYVDLGFVESLTTGSSLDGEKFSKLACGLLKDDDKDGPLSHAKYAFWHKRYVFPSTIAEQMIKETEVESIDTAVSDLLKALGLDEESMARKHPDIINKKVFCNGNFKTIVYKSLYIKYLKEDIPEEFTKLVNADFWNLDEMGPMMVPNFSLHAKLKLIARFGLDNGIEGLYSKENIKKLGDIIKMIYTSNPDEVEVLESNKTRLKFYFKDKIKKDETIEVVLTPQGKIVTIFPKA